MQPRRTRPTGGRPHVDRVTVLTVIFCLFAALVVAKLFHVQVLRHTFYAVLAESQHASANQFAENRGEIFAQSRHDGLRYPIAVNQDLTLVYAVPRSVKDPIETANALLPLFERAEASTLVSDDGDILPVNAREGSEAEESDDTAADDPAAPETPEAKAAREAQIVAEAELARMQRLETLTRRLSKPDDEYESLEHYVPDDVAADIRALNLPGVGFSKETVRYYPERTTFSHVTGFVGFSGDRRTGQYGIEEYFNDLLAGVASPAGNADGNSSLPQQPVEGSDVVLTIEYPLQFYACEQLAAAVAKHGADRGTVIVLQPATGAVLALCNAPAFDPNHYSEVENQRVFANDALFDQYEPGSVFKSITMSAAIDTGEVRPDTTYVDEGQVQIGGYTIQNSDGSTHGEQTMTFVLEESLNTGAIFAARRVGIDRFREYIERFGFGAKSGITLDAEMAGDISTLSLDNEIYMATASYGQGITVTPLQLASAYGAIANGGTLMKPYIVASMVAPGGQETVTEPAVVRSVVSAETARLLSAMLVSVVENGHSKRAHVDGYYVAGKTGTAQIPRSDGAGYEGGRHKDTFVGFGPVTDPQFVVLVKVDNPKDVSWAEGSAVPVAGNILKFLFEYYQIPPEA